MVNNLIRKVFFIYAHIQTDKLWRELIQSEQGLAAVQENKKHPCKWHLLLIDDDHGGDDHEGFAGSSAASRRHFAAHRSQMGSSKSDENVAYFFYSKISSTHSSLTKLHTYI